MSSEGPSIVIEAVSPERESLDVVPAVGAMVKGGLVTVNGVTALGHMG